MSSPSTGSASPSPQSDGALETGAAFSGPSPAPTGSNEAVIRLRPVETDVAPHAPPSPGEAEQREDLLQRYATHNFLTMTAFLIVQRLGWIFKTESIIMPAVADLIGVGGWLRGCLPVLSRFGLSVPPLFSSPYVRRSSQKKRLLFCTSTCMSISFLFLAGVWLVRPQLGEANVAWLFLAAYTVFFMAVGINQLVLGTLTGKLIRADIRGRLMLAANVLGAGVAISAALWLMPKWLQSPDSFFNIFALSGSIFGICALIGLCHAEPPDDDYSERHSAMTMFRQAGSVLRHDKMFRRVAWIGGLFGLSFALFPHYQAIGLGGMGLGLGDMLQWVVIQNIGTALFSVLIGPMADRRGNRAVLRGVMLCVLAAPLLAISLPLWSDGARYFPVVFLLVGLTPVTIRVLHNYVLELSEPADHPLYISTMSLVTGAPVLFSPVLGMIIDSAGFAGVFLGVSGLVFIAWCLTWGLSEPRHTSQASS